jgi:hypothetical protein
MNIRFNPLSVTNIPITQNAKMKYVVVEVPVVPEGMFKRARLILTFFELLQSQKRS